MRDAEEAVDNGAGGTPGRPAAFAGLLRRHRSAAGLTQEALAERAGLGVRTVQGLEGGATRPHPGTVRRLAQALGLAGEPQARFEAAAQPAPRAPRALRALQCLPGAPGAPADARPPRRRSGARPTNLPLQLTSFVGRGRELAALAALLATSRLVTLTGPGGVGKTRLALQAAADVIEAYPGGVWLVDLAPLADAALVPATTLAAVGTSGAADLSGPAAEARLVEHLRPQRALLLLDNCEHLLDACARLADALLRRCPGVRVLATSREPLGVAGEAAWRVPSLGLPEPAAASTAARVEQAEAVRLFVARARAAHPAFRLDDANAPAVAEVCRRLDGLPLAVELAAARVRVLTAEQIAARLDDRFRLLTGGGRSALRRQQTLQAAMDWSHDLLSGPDRALFRRLAVFAGGFPLDAAETVCTGEPVEAHEVLDLVTSLVDKSLVVAEPRGTEQRYRLLETVRQYAADQLRQAGEDAALRDRHLDWCVALAQRASEAERSRGTDRYHEARGRYIAEWDNVRAALAWGAATPDGAARALDILAGVILTPRPSQAEKVRWLETLLDAAPARTPTRARALLQLDFHRRLHRDLAGARAAGEEARAIAGEIGDEELATDAASRSALVAANLGEYEGAVAELERCLDLARGRSAWTWVERFTRDLGVIAVAMGDFARARAALTMCRDVGLRHDSRYTLRPRLFLAVIDRLTGDLRGARTALEALCEEAGAWDSGGSQLDRFNFHEPARWALANIARDGGRFDEARRLLRQSLEDLRRHGEVGQLSEPTGLVGLLDIAAGHAARGVTILAACAPESGLIGTIHVPELRLEAPVFLERARQVLGAPAYDAAWARGQAMTLDEAVQLALEPVPQPTTA